MSSRPAGMRLSVAVPATLPKLPSSHLHGAGSFLCVASSGSSLCQLARQLSALAADANQCSSYTDSGTVPP